MRKENLLYINGKDAWLTWSALLIEDSYDNLESPADLKAYVENYARSQPGKQVLVRDSQPTDRTVQLMFDIQGDSIRDYQMKKNALLAEMTGRLFDFAVVPLRTSYKMFLPPGYFLSLSSDTGMTSGKLSVRLNEPDPTDRITGDKMLPWVFKDGKWQQGFWLRDGKWGEDL